MKDRFVGTPWEEIWQALADRDYLVLDTETTGLYQPEVVSIAVVDRRGRILIDEIVRPGKPIEPGASAITGITDAMVRDRPEFPAIYPSLREILSDRFVVIYNARYDMNVLQNTHRRYGLAMPRFTSWCAMDWFARLYGQWDNVRGSYTWQRLATAAQYFRVSQLNAHSALGDCLTTLHVLQAALKQAHRLHPHVDRLL